MVRKMANLKLYKLILAIRYPHAALLLDNRGRIASYWRGKYGLTDWRIAQNDVYMHSMDHSIYANLQLQQCAIVMELPSSSKAFVEFASQFACKAISDLEIKSVDRIGIRIIQVEPRLHYKLLQSTMRKKLYRLDDESWNKIGGLPEDIGMSFILRIGDKLGNFTIGPMEKEQLSTYFVSEKVKENLPESVLFVDADIYQKEPSETIFNKEKTIEAFISEVIGQEKILLDNFMSQFGDFA